MGNCVQKQGVVQAISVQPVKANNYPTNPNEDVNGEYIWINMCISDKYLVFTQNKGYRIVSDKEIKPYSNVWLCKKRECLIET